MNRMILVIFLLLSINIYSVEKWDIFEVEFKGPKVENPFKDVELSAEFQYKNRKIFVEGFYDGDRIYKLRFMPDEEGKWTYTVKSNIDEMDKVKGEFICTPPSKNNHGPVKVNNIFHFAYRDGEPFYVLGTTCYAWIHQSTELINETIQTLDQNSFNKIRMTVMPKRMIFNQNEPLHYPYEGSLEEGWNYNMFNVDFFRNLESQLNKLRKRNIEADLILFHPYDSPEWNFSKGSIEHNNFYLRYLIARLAAYRNIWWSMANEYDMMGKPEEEWEIYFKTIQTYDPYQHLTSIHNGKALYDYSKPWISHLSMQTPFLEKTQAWREKYQKPVINDEFVYEGNIAHNWGNLTPEEMVNRFWTLYARGGYGSHGETYEHPNDILWWAKGGKLYGKSPSRLSFLLKIMNEGPENLIPFHNEWNKDTYLYSEKKDYYLYYYGNSQQLSAILYLNENHDYKIEIIDVWDMTIEELEISYSGTATIPLPQKPYIAVRATAVE